MKTTHAIVLIFESFEIQTLAGNTAMLFLRKVQKSIKAFLKRLSKTCKSRRKGTPFILTFKKSVSHFLKKVISRWRKGFLKKKVFLLFWILACKRKEKKCFSSNPNIHAESQEGNLTEKKQIQKHSNNNCSYPSDYFNQNNFSVKWRCTF